MILIIITSLVYTRQYTPVKRNVIPIMFTSYRIMCLKCEINKMHVNPTLVVIN